MRTIVSLLVISLFLVSCAGQVPGTPVEETGKSPTSSTSPDQPAAYPVPLGDTPVPNTSAYPEPGTSGSISPSIPLSGYEPLPGDDALTRDKVMLDLASSHIDTTNPSQVQVILQVTLSDPCHQLRVVVTPPDAKNVINLEVYSLVDPGVGCITVIKSFTAIIHLGSFTIGRYSVLVNGEQLGEFGDAYAPQPGDEQLTQGEVFVDMAASQLLRTDTQPVQVSVLLKGDLPTPCHRLRVVTKEPDENNAINLKVYSLVDPDEICITVLEPFEAAIPLGSYSNGHIFVYVNGELLEEFDT